MKSIIIVALLLFSLYTFSQPGNLTKEDLERELKPITSSIQSLQTENKRLKSDLRNVNSRLNTANKIIDSLQIKTQSNTTAINNEATKLGLRISNTEVNSNQKIDAIDNSFSKKSLISIIGVLLAVLFSIAIYLLLRKHQRKDKSDIEVLIESTKKSLLKESVALDSKLADILETQLKIIQEERTVNPNNFEDNQIDHSMPLKVADEITRINAYANSLDPNSQDAKALKSSVKRLTNTFKAAHYDIVDLLGQKYDDGLKVIVVNAVPDEKLKPGEEIISRIIKPLVKYNGAQIQAAQVDISVGQ